MVNPRVLRIQGRSATVRNIVACYFRRTRVSDTGTLRWIVPPRKWSGVVSGTGYTLVCST